MAQEIELKFIVEKDSVDALRQHLHTLSGEHHAPVQLLNIYYETPDSWLRRHDMGLRIRGASGRYEMTMKIAGRVVGGLHQRPEYNIDISKPNLSWNVSRRKSGRMASCLPRWRNRCSRCSAPISGARNGW